MTIEEIASGFEEPWAIGFLPDDSYLITERDGELWRMHGDKRYRLDGVPDVVASGQGGLLDVLIPNDFAVNREIFISYSK